MRLFMILLKGIRTVVWAILRIAFNSHSLPLPPNTGFLSWWKASRLLSEWADGIKLDGTRALKRELSFRHVLVTAPTGSGKSTKLILPNLLTIDNCSLFASDPSGELYRYSAGALARRGYRVLALQPADPARSLCYNPLQRAGNNPTALKKVAKILIETAFAEPKGDNAFWNTGAEAIIFLLMKILAAQPQSRFRNLANVRFLLSVFSASRNEEDGGAVGVLASKYLDTSSWRDFLALLAEDDKTLSGRIATAITALENFNDPDLASLTSTDSIDLAAFRREKTAIFWIIPSGADTRYYRSLQTIFLSQFLDGLVKESGLDCFLFLDELGNLGRIQGLGEMVSVLRKFKVGIVAALQSASQLQAVYGLYESQTILENFNTRIFYPGLPLAATEQLSRTLGVIEIEEDAGDGRTIKRRREVMTAAEIRQMDGEITIIDNHKPIWLQSRPWFKDWELKKLATVPPPEIAAAGTDEAVAYIPLPRAGVVTSRETEGQQKD